eukprot:4188433-Prorocentrum_lima.AAC.1
MFVSKECVLVSVCTYSCICASRSFSVLVALGARKDTPQGGGRTCVAACCCPSSSSSGVMDQLVQECIK